MCIRDSTDASIVKTFTREELQAALGEDGYYTLTFTTQADDDLYFRVRGLSSSEVDENGDPVTHERDVTNDRPARFDYINDYNYSHLSFYANPVWVNVDENQIIDVDTTLLEKTVAYALTLSTEGVTDSAVAAFEAALESAQAVLAKENPSQAEVNAAWDALLEGIWGLGLVQGDKAELNLLIAKAEAMDETKYVADHWQELVDALANAKDVAADGDAMKEDIQPVAQALLDTILAQRFKADKSILEDLIGKAESINLDGYTAESVATFRTALANAQAVMANESLSEDDQATVDNAVAALNAAMNGLTAGGAPETTDKPQATQKPESVPQTGDNAQLGLVFSVLVLSAAGLAAVVTMRRRRS